MKYNENKTGLSFEDAVLIEATHRTFADKVVKNKKAIRNPRTGEIGMLEPGPQGMMISGPKYGGTAASLGLIGAMSLTARSKARYQKRNSDMPTNENKEQWETTAREIYEGLTIANGGILGQNTLKATIDFRRNAQLCKNQKKYFKKLGLKPEEYENLPYLDFIDSAAGDPGTKEIKAYNQWLNDPEKWEGNDDPEKPEKMIPYFYFESNPEKLKRRMALAKRRPLSKPTLFAIENGAASGHDGSIMNKYETMKLFLKTFSSEEIKELPPFLLAGEFTTGQDFFDAVFNYGASGIRTGAIFTTCAESRASDYHKQLIVDTYKGQQIPYEILNKYTTEQIEQLKVMLGGNLDFIGKVPSTSGISATGFRTQLILDTLLGKVQGKKLCAGPKKENKGCLIECGKTALSMIKAFPDIDPKVYANIGDYCIEQALTDAIQGKKETGLFFTSKSAIIATPEKINMEMRLLASRIYIQASHELLGSKKHSNYAQKLEQRINYLRERPQELAFRLLN